MTIKRW